MYRYDEIDQRLVDERVTQFKEQTRRYLAGELSEEQFRPLRLQNGLYIQRQAPMLRVAIPYGLLGAYQLRKLAEISRQYDRSYGHFSTRQNIQFNWPKLEEVPNILADLASVQMHAIQTSGNCIRNITVDHFAGLAPDELVNPLAWAEILRQWSTFHPEFAFLPRKFKIAISGAKLDRAAIQLHDIGLQATRAPDGAVGFQVFVGGGMGRTPVIGQEIEPFVEEADLVNYLEAIMRVYNLFGRRDNKYKARIKILVKELGLSAFRNLVEEEFERMQLSHAPMSAAHIRQIEARFIKPEHLARVDLDLAGLQATPGFLGWTKRNVHGHQVPGYAAVSISLKRNGIAPGDASDLEMDAIADIAERYSFGLLRVTHEQNLLLPDVAQEQLPALYADLKALRLAEPNIGLITNIIACPGGDFCSLANAVSLPVAQALFERFDALDYQHEIGELDLNISGCINSCGHHHVGHIGILGVDKAGEAYYQVTIGGNQGTPALVGKIIGPSFKQEEVPDVVEQLIRTYLSLRDSEHERFVDVVRRTGITPFKEAVYANTH
jgi:sulfite reductase (NADPH) hemoprotein beta-component